MKIGEAPSYGKPVVIYDPSSTGALNYMDLGREFLTRNGIEIKIENEITDIDKDNDNNVKENIEEENQDINLNSSNNSVNG